MPVGVKKSDVLVPMQEATEEAVKFILIAKIDSNIFKDGSEIGPIIISVKVLLDCFSWLLSSV